MRQKRWRGRGLCAARSVLSPCPERSGTRRTAHSAIPRPVEPNVDKLELPSVCLASDDPTALPCPVGLCSWAAGEQPHSALHGRPGYDKLRLRTHLLNTGGWPKATDATREGRTTTTTDPWGSGQGSHPSPESTCHAAQASIKWQANRLEIHEAPLRLPGAEIRKVGGYCPPPRIVRQSGVCAKTDPNGKLALLKSKRCRLANRRSETAYQPHLANSWRSVAHRISSQTETCNQIAWDGIQIEEWAFTSFWARPP